MAAYDDDEMPPTWESDAVARIGLVTMKKPTYSKREVSLTADSLTVGVELNATFSAAAREWLDLVVVADIGTWEPEQERILKLKKALAFVMQKLTPMDRLSIVTRNSTSGSSIDRLCPLSCMTPATRAHLRAQIGGLTSCCVNIKRSFKVALAILRGRVHTDGRTAAILFVTDDYERAGNARSVKPGDVPVHTFGFGTQADHELMVDMAKKSPGGTYSYVEPDESDLCEPFSQLLGGLLTTVAQDVQLTLTTKSRDVEAMVLSPGIDYHHTSGVNDRGENQIVVSFGTLFSGESRKVLLNFTLRPSSKNGDELDGAVTLLAEARHSYVAQRGQENQLPPRDIAIRRTKKPAAAPSIHAAELQAEELRHQHADSISATAEIAGRGRLEEARDKLQDRLQSAESIMLDDGEMVASILRAELLQLIKFMASSDIYKKQGRPYAFAVVSSHGRQRTAGKGVVDPDACLYTTRRMITHLEQAWLAKRLERNAVAALPTAEDDVKQETAANPLPAVAGPIAFDHQNAIQSMQAVV